MKYYILQEKEVRFEGVFWFDIYNSQDIEFIVKLKNNYELKNGNKYRVVFIYE